MPTYYNCPPGHYVYAYIRSSDSSIAHAGTPYYIGKGIGKRAWAKHKRNNGSDLRPIDNTNIIIVEANLTAIGACALERWLIRWYGRKDIKTGILQNMTDGGDGATNVSESTRAKLSSANTGKIQSAETTAKRLASRHGYRHSPETKAKMSEAKLDKTPTPETRARMSAANKGRVISQEQRDKISSSLKGRSTGPRIAEVRLKISKSRTGIGHSDEAKVKIAAASFNRTHSAATREKLRELAKAQWAAKKQLTCL